MIFQLHQTKLYDYLVYDSTESQIKHHIPHPFHRLIFRFSIRNVLVVVLLLFFSFFFSLLYIMNNNSNRGVTYKQDSSPEFFKYLDSVSVFM